MTIAIIARVTCDVAGCASTADLQVLLYTEAEGIAYHQSEVAVAEPDTRGTGWNQYPPGVMVCPSCMQRAGGGKSKP